MKHIINRLFTTAFISVLIGLTACNEDYGNYDYIDINKVDSILDIADSYPVYIGYQLKIKPRLVYSLGSEGDVFTYKWYYYDNGTWTFLQEGFEFDQEIEGVIGRNRTLAFEAHNEVTDVYYRKTFKIVLTAPIGYVALCETADGYDVDMVSYVSTDSIFKLAKNVLDGMESEVPHHEGQRPIDIVTAAGPNNLNLYPTPAFADGTNYTVYILTDQYTTRLASKDFSWRSEYNIESSVEGNSELDVNYKQQGKPIVAQKLKITDQQGRRHWFYHVDEAGKGNWYAYQLYPLMRLLANPINMESTTLNDGATDYRYADPNSRFEPSKEMYANQFTNGIFWDKTKGRFMHSVFSSTSYSFRGLFYSVPFTETATTPFSFLDSDYEDVVNMGEVFTSATGMDGYAIMKLKSGGYRYIQFAASTPAQSATTVAMNTKRRKSDFSATSAIGNAKFIATYPQSTVMWLYYVTTDNKVYKVDTSGATALETEITNLFVRDGYSEITAFKFTYPNTNGSAVYKVSESVEKGLVVATYNASKAKEECGKLEVFTLTDANSGTLELAKYPTDNMIAAEPALAPKQVTMSFTELGKVVGLDFKKK